MYLSFVTAVTQYYNTIKPSLTKVIIYAIHYFRLI